MAKKIHRVVCPILKEAGIPDDNSESGVALCLFCPYDNCIYDAIVDGRGKKHSLRKQLRNKEMRRLHEKGKTPKELQAMFELSRDTVRRALLKEKDEN